MRGEPGGERFTGEPGRVPAGGDAAGQLDQTADHRRMGDRVGQTRRVAGQPGPDRDEAERVGLP